MGSETVIGTEYAGVPAGPFRDAILKKIADRREVIYCRYDTLKNLSWAKHIRPQHPNVDYAGYAYKHYADLDRRGGREYDRVEHTGHVRLGENGRYLWCAHCMGTPWRHWRDRPRGSD